MKRFLIVLVLTFFVLSLSAQNKSTFTYSEDTILAPTSREDYDWFGSPCLSGDMMMIGSSISAAVCGAGYVNYYEKNMDGDWDFIQRIESPEPEDCDHFGSDIGYYDSTLVITAYRDDNGGSGYIFRLQDTSWNYMQTITGSDTEADDGWGEGIDIDRGVILSGSFLDDTNSVFNVGSVYAFTEDTTGTWIERAIFRPEGIRAWDYFGSRISMENGVAAIGAFKRDDGVTDGGAVYFYNVSKSYTVNYLAGPNGNISGDISQTVNHGDNSTTVTAIPDMGYAFIDWSDKSTDNPRTDYNITSCMTITANFDTVIVNVPVTNIEITGTDDITVNNGTLQLGVNILPVDATNKVVKWSSSDEQIATVNNTGLVNAVANGDVKIIASATDGSGKADTVDITVSGQIISVTGVSIIAVDTITVGDTITIIADLSPDNATIKSVSWSIDDPNIAVIDPTSGILTGISPGEVYVTVTTEDGNYTAYKKIVVVAATSIVTFANELFKIYPNPSAGTLIIENKRISENADIGISIYDLSSNCIHKEQLKENKIIIKLQSGVYLIKISDGLTESTHKIFVH